HAHLRGDDAYWMAERMAAIDGSTLSRAIRAGALSRPAARARLWSLLWDRRRQVIAWAFARTTPCELVDVRQRGDDGIALVLGDLGAALDAAGAGAASRGRRRRSAGESGPSSGSSSAGAASGAAEGRSARRFQVTL